MKRWVSVLVISGSLCILGANEKEWSAVQLGMIFKFEQQRETALQNIRKADETISKAHSIIVRAKEAGNKNAEGVAVMALQKAEDTKRQYELNKLQIDKNIAYVRNRMNEHGGYDTKIAGMITNHTGRVRVISGKPPYEAIGMEGEHPGYFEEGDMIETYGNSRAEVQFLDGRGSMTIGEYSRVKIEKKDPLSETFSLLKGKIHASVEKAEVFEAWLEKQAQMAAENPNKLLAHDFNAIRAWVKSKSKKFEVRTPAVVVAVRGTTFDMSNDELGTTTIELIEGELAVTNVKTLGEILLKGGQKMTISAEGVMRIESLTLPVQGGWKE